MHLDIQKWTLRLKYWTKATKTWWCHVFSSYFMHNLWKQCAVTSLNLQNNLPDVYIFFCTSCENMNDWFRYIVVEGRCKHSFFRCRFAKIAYRIRHFCMHAPGSLQFRTGSHIAQNKRFSCRRVTILVFLAKVIRWAIPFCVQGFCIRSCNYRSLLGTCSLNLLELADEYFSFSKHHGLQ